MTASQTLQNAAELVAAWPAPYAAPLAELLVAEAQHAADLERQSDEAGWDRYPPGSCLVALAHGVIEDESRRRLLPPCPNECYLAGRCGCAPAQPDGQTTPTTPTDASGRSRAPERTDR